MRERASFLTVFALNQTKDEDGVQTYNLRVCSVKYSDGYDRRFCFEVISPNRYVNIGTIFCVCTHSCY